ncbi:hypothetical protein Dimus_003649, partial [Dionaea muscipula]
CFRPPATHQQPATPPAATATITGLPQPSSPTTPHHLHLEQEGGPPLLLPPMMVKNQSRVTDDGEEAGR